MALILVAFITFLISGLVQIANRKESFFMKDCDDRIELKKLELKARLKRLKTGNEFSNSRQEKTEE